MITIFADASWCQHTKVAGWGAWVKADGWQKGEVLGGCIDFSISSGMSELRAIANAILFCKKQNWFAEGESIMVQSDSTAALQVLLRCTRVRVFYTSSADISDARILGSRKKPLDKEELHFLNKIQDAVLGSKIYVRHVKGHKKGATSRSWVNERCDAEAKLFLQIARQRVSQKNLEKT